jgi:hypothetical protein
MLRMQEMAFPCFKFKIFLGIIPLISNDKLWLIFFFTFCAFFSFFYLKYKMVSINFRAKLGSQNAGNGISVLQISKCSGEYTPDPPPFMRGILATHVAFSYCYPPLIYYLTERSLFKKCLPTGKSLKKALPYP